MQYFHTILHLVPFCKLWLVFAVCVGQLVVESSGVGSAGCVVMLTCMESELWVKPPFPLSHSKPLTILSVTLCTLILFVQLTTLPFFPTLYLYSFSKSHYILSFLSRKIPFFVWCDVWCTHQAEAAEGIMAWATRATMTYISFVAEGQMVRFVAKTLRVCCKLYTIVVLT